MSQVKAPIVKEADPSADKSIWQDGEESLDEEVIIISTIRHYFIMYNFQLNQSLLSLGASCKSM